MAYYDNYEIHLMNISHYILGVCLNSVPGDPELSVELCRMLGETQQRTFAVKDDWSDERREWFYQTIKRLDHSGCEGRC